MSKRALRVLLSVVVVGGALTALMVSTLGEDARYFKHVDEVMPNASAWHGKNLKLHGYVEKAEHRKGTLEYRFTVQHQGHSVLATYTGFVPDNFKDGMEVILTGTLTPDGFRVDPDGILGKCPSKYEETAPKYGATGNPY
jgi:cytochrome c-type biogenesis protein CcmE